MTANRPGLVCVGGERDRLDAGCPLVKEGLIAFSHSVGSIACVKLRVDLLKHLKAEDLAEAAEASVHRFKPEPLFSQNGTGSLSSASTEERAREVAHSAGLTRKLERRARRSSAC